MQSASLSRADIVAKLRALGPVLREKGVARIDLFGSVAAGAARADSDVDLLVELSRPMGFEFFTLEQSISKLLGAPVELSTRAGMRPRVLADAEKHLVKIF